MKKASNLVSLFIIVFSVIGCTLAPQFINHPPPDLKVDFSSFTDVACPPDENGLMLCAADSPLAAFDCDRIAEPDALLGGLVPSYPLAVCLFEGYRHTGEDYERSFQVEADGYVYQTGGLSPTYVRYVLFDGNTFRLLKTPQDVRETFAPIETANEALSFALMLNDLSAYFGLTSERGMRYLDKKVEDTYVEETSDGYLVHLFYRQFFGCGPHTTSAVDLLVKQDGSIETLTTKGMYENPDEDNLCID